MEVDLMTLMVASWLNLKYGFSSVPSLITGYKHEVLTGKKIQTRGFIVDSQESTQKEGEYWVANTPAPWYKTVATCEALRSTRAS